jgi:lysophospholipase L1-like esterase
MPIMIRSLLRFALLFLTVVASAAPPADGPPAEPATYLAKVTEIFRKDWPGNRMVNIVCHGHSVPAGYFKTPEVRSLEAYPHLLRAGLAERFPHAMINVIVTAIGGENSVSGAARFEKEVLTHRPDVVLIDYALNDRRVGLEAARKAWTAMIEQAQARGVKVVLLTPTPDLGAKLDDPADPLNQHAEQIRQLAKEYRVGLVDSLAAFQQFAKNGGEVATLMSQGNHPNGKGHALVARALLEWFP